MKPEHPQFAMAKAALGLETNSSVLGGPGYLPRPSMYLYKGPYGLY